MKHTLKLIILNVSRILFGLTFVLSGFVKAVDPMGSAYKFIDYFRAFDLSFLDGLATPLAVLLSTLEFSIGALILWGVFRYWSTLLGLLMMIFFTPLTLYLALADPVKDCGCFGDALILSNWETFAKNVVLLCMAFILFFWRKRVKPLVSIQAKYFVLLLTILYAGGISFIALAYMPIVDFRPFKVGVNIPQEMQSEAGAEQYVLVYEKDGVAQEFTLENYPASDSTWTFVESRTQVNPDAKQPTIEDFFINNEQGDDVTQEILSNSNPTFLLISPDWEQSDLNYNDKIQTLYTYAQNRGYDFYAVSTQDLDKEYVWKEKTQAKYPFLYSDATILETIIRPRPGVVMLIEGDIIWKSHPYFLPEFSQIETQIANHGEGVIEKNNNTRIILYAFLAYFIPFLLLLSLDKFLIKNN